MIEPVEMALQGHIPSLAYVFSLMVSLIVGGVFYYQCYLLKLLHQVHGGFVITLILAREIGSLMISVTTFLGLKIVFSHFGIQFEMIFIDSDKFDLKFIALYSIVPIVHFLLLKFVAPKRVTANSRIKTLKD